MAKKGPEYCFLIPQPRGLEAKVPQGKPKERDLCAINPLKQQFEPTPESPVPQRFKMAGGA